MFIFGFLLGKGVILCYTSSMYSHKQLFGFLALLMGATLGVPMAHAADLTNTIITNGSMIVGMIITAMNALMWVLFGLLSIVTDPDLIFSEGTAQNPGGIVPILFSLWQISRNIVNIGFAVLLIVGAIMTIISASTERVKGLLPKFVMAVILVNFSWFIPRVIFDVSQIAAYSVYQLPTFIVGGSDCFTEELGPPVKRVPCQVVNDFRFFEETEKPDITEGQDGWTCPLKPIICVQLKDYNSPEVLERNDKQSVVFNGLIVNYARLKTLANVIDAGRVAGKDPSEIKALLLWFVKIIVVLVIHIALFFPILALVAAFFIRIPVLWLTMAFMPFVALGFVVDQIKGETDKITDNFIKAAFLPAVVGVPFAIGFIMLNVASHVALPGKFGEIKVPLLTGLDTLGQIFWLALSLGILWKGVFMALERGPEVVNKFTNGIREVGAAAGRTALKAPLSIPIIPSPVAGGKATSMLGAMKTIDPRNIEAQLGNDNMWAGMQQNADQRRGEQIADQAVTNFQAKININNIGSDPNSQKNLSDALKELREKSPNLRENLNNDETLRAYFEKMEKLGRKLDDQQQRVLRDALRRDPPAAPAAPGAPTT